MMQEACGWEEKAKKARRLSRKGTNKRMPLIDVVFDRLLLRSEEVNMMRLRRSMRTYNPLQQAGHAGHDTGLWRYLFWPWRRRRRAIVGIFFL